MATGSPDIKELITASLRAAVWERCNSQSHVALDDACEWCDPLVSDLLAYAEAAGQRLREARQ